jgi:hypothetical protein
MKWFRVEVSDREGKVVAIEPEMLAGRHIGEDEEETIRAAIRHLQGFIGNAIDEANDVAADGELRLKPCPFCDSEAKIENAAEVGPNSYVVVCQNPECMSSSQVRVAEKDDVTRILTEVWNLRTDQINASYEADGEGVK